MRIEVGRGLEGVVPDIAAKRIVSDVIVPYFRQGDFAGAQAALERAAKIYWGVMICVYCLSHAPALLILTSACHGVEGYCGSGAQIALLGDAELRRRAQEAAHAGRGHAVAGEQRFQRQDRCRVGGPAGRRRRGRGARSRWTG